GNLVGISAPIAGHESDHRLLVADEHERLHDLGELAAHRVRGVLRRVRAVGELLDTRFGAGFPEERGHALDRLRQRPRHEPRLPSGARPHPRLMKRTSSKPDASTRSMSSAGAGESIENTISAVPPSPVRETAMFAMLTPASPNIVPTLPITPGTSS